MRNEELFRKELDAVGSILAPNQFSGWGCVCSADLQPADGVQGRDVTVNAPEEESFFQRIATVIADF